MKDDKFEGCGIKDILATDSSDPFHKACVTHDKAYEKGSVMQKMSSRKQADDIFLAQCLEIAGSCWPLKVKAYVYYGIIRAVGWLYWEGKRSA